MLFEVFLGNLNVVVGDSGFCNDGGIRAGGDDDPELHKLLDRGKTKLVILHKAVRQDRLGHLCECPLIGVEPKHLLGEEMSLQTPDERVRGRVRWSGEQDLGLGVVPEDLKSRLDDGLGLTSARRTADEVGNRVTGSDNVRHGLSLDLVEILIVKVVEVGNGRRNVVFLLRPDPSSKDVVCRLEK